MVSIEQLKSQKTKQLQAEQLASSIATDLRKAIQQKGWASIAFSGGSTPGLMMKSLAQHQLDWSVVDITLVDERCVPTDHERSNARLIDQNLLRALSVPANFFPLYLNGESNEERLGRFSNFHLPFDVVHLGMGEDAHTASFFPDAPNLSEMLELEGTRPVIQTQSTSSIEARLTWSLAALLKAKKIYLQISGSSKYEILYKALSAAGSQPLTKAIREQYPVLAVLEKTTVMDTKGIEADIFYTE